MIGRELAFDTRLSALERLYIRLLGVPINGLRIRARRILPRVTGPYHTVLDAGCGRGIFSLELAKVNRTSTVLGIDTDRDQIKANNLIAEKSGLPNCRFQAGDLLKLSYREKFDLIISVDILEHITDDWAVCQKFYQALIQGGTLILHVPAKYRRWFFTGKKLNFNVPGHVRPGYEIHEIKKLLEKAHFTIVSLEYTYGLVETITNNISYSITGAEMKNKTLYSLVFPFLLIISYFGRYTVPVDGSGLLAIAQKK